MGLISRIAGRRSLVPAAVLNNLAGSITSRLITYDGRLLYEPRSPLPPFTEFLAPTLEAARIDPERTIAEIAEAARAQGGWALYGGHRLLEDAVGLDCQHPEYLALLDAALAFLQASGCSGMCLNGHERDRWVAVHGSMASFWDMEAVATPAPGQEPPVAPLEDGELRRIAQLEDRADSNVILMQRDPEGGFTALIDAAWSDDDPRRCQNEWQRADDVHSLLRLVGESLAGLPYWTSDELRPYIPYRRRPAS